MAQYLPLFRPGQTVTFDVEADLTGGAPVQLGTADRSVVPATAASASYIGVAAHDAGPGDKVTVEISKPIHELTAAAAITLGAEVEAAGAGKVQTLTTGRPIGIAISAAAADGDTIQVLGA